MGASAHRGQAGEQSDSFGIPLVLSQIKGPGPLGAPALVLSSRAADET